MRQTAFHIIIKIYNTSSYEIFSLKPHAYFLFVQDLHGVELVRFFMFDEHNSAEWASAQSLEPIEVIQACCALRKHIISGSETVNWGLKMLKFYLYVWVDCSSFKCHVKDKYIS